VERDFHSENGGYRCEEEARSNYKCEAQGFTARSFSWLGFQILTAELLTSSLLCALSWPQWCSGAVGQASNRIRLDFLQPPYLHVTWPQPVLLGCDGDSSNHVVFLLVFFCMLGVIRHNLKCMLGRCTFSFFHSFTRFSHLGSFGRV